MNNLKGYLAHNIILVIWFMIIGAAYFYSSVAFYKHLIILGGILGFFGINFYYQQTRARLSINVLLEYFLVGSLVYLLYLVIAL
ncbi:hypothetical protein GW755_02735 [bacterium]|nr:hypothetical protein [bacterium]